MLCAKRSLGAIIVLAAFAVASTMIALVILVLTLAALKMMRSMGSVIVIEGMEEQPDLLVQPPIQETQQPDDFWRQSHRQQIGPQRRNAAELDDRAVPQQVAHTMTMRRESEIACRGEGEESRGEGEESRGEGEESKGEGEESRGEGEESRREENNPVPLPPIQESTQQLDNRNMPVENDEDAGNQG